MKKIMILFSVFFGLFVMYSGNADMCYNSANMASKKYKKANWEKQIDTSKISDETQKRNAKIRDLCFFASVEWHLFCDWAKCLKRPDDEKFIYYTVKDVCRYKEIDCFNDDVDNIFNVLRESQDALFSIVFSDMDDVVKSVYENNEQVGLIDVDQTVCYRTNSNGETIWHAFAKTNKNINSFAALCVSRLQEDGAEILYNSILEQPDKDGKTVAKISIDSGKPEYVFDFVGDYAKEVGEDCSMLEDRLSESAGIDKDKARSVLKKCY